MPVRFELPDDELRGLNRVLFAGLEELVAMLIERGVLTKADAPELRNRIAARYRAGNDAPEGEGSSSPDDDEDHDH
jgi:hypothetical protein